MRALLGVLLFFVTAAAAEPALAVRVVDAASGKAIDGARCVVADPVAKRVRARLAGPRYESVVAPRPGDALFVHARGYDLVRRTLAAGERRVRVALQASHGRCEILFGDAPPEVEIVRMVSPEDGWLRDALRDVYVETVRTENLRVSLDGGMRTRVVVRCSDALFWPATLDVEAGRSYRLQRDEPRTVRVELPADARVTVADFFPDMLWHPKLPPGRIDAWRDRLNAPGWLRAELARGGPLQVLPSIPFHFFGVVDGKPVYRHVARSDDRLDLAPPYTLRRVRRPLVDGVPPPEGAVVAPGRLDLLTVSSIPLPGCTWRVGAGEWPDNVRLPVSDWITVWHPEIGLAHLVWRARESPRGSAYKGRAVMSVPPGLVARGHVSVYPIWRGTGHLQTVPPEKPLRREFDGRDPIWFRGLPFGRYGMSVEVDLRPERGVEHTAVSRTYEFEVTADEPTRSFQLPLR